VGAQPVNLEGVDTGFYKDIPRLGEHNDEILAEAGLTAAEIAALKATGALG
jgi:formyl-CoA transferase